ncbi:DNA-binding response regulator [Clostridium thermosuccinogenes]|jgi:two-component system KDP operon response regulator KdpE|uniref:Stage 0 sporulation protein A homolog n=1 Tax=Clostridium thermosuccinogenes TaxID=84032 RepID=A0A2K2FR37_9CLOT|nr:response regulator transcription factor [Pseudoclostridium thermosuccinogenes]AUS96963.1 DNA-binding response regulator [Pseudoclostridium thermosuccinogenes]PNT99620.1 DNA-binding response regulator [Pseudoclostridium thermosuccinogenes]PNU01246.1 DNA-binding response regulator [Pseudoclostridium thermosuccinogenes]
MADSITVLIVEDDKYIMSLVNMFLKDEGYRTITTSSGKEAVALFYANNPDLILLDLGLPDIDGMDVIRQIREKSNAPIIVLSAREEESDIINALDCGADDYMTKPFYTGELMARIRVAQRKINSMTNPDNAKTFTCDYLTVDYGKGLVFVDGEEVHLTPIEYKLLRLLIANRGKVLTHNYIISQIWGFGEVGDAKSLRVFMASLRRKIERDTANPRFILTQVGIGYRFADK